MYALSVEAKKDLQSYTIDGTIGSLEFDNDNVLKGSLAFSGQCVNPSTFSLGGVGIRQMSCAFLGIDIAENAWIGKEISLSITINDAETYPIGVFTVDSASRSRGVVRINAYDNMVKFEKPVSVDVGAYGTLYEWLTMACEACGVELGMNSAAVAALPNGNQSFYLEEMGDIETWRDLLFWLSVKVVGFATINRSGQLILVTYHSTVDDTIDYNVRFNTSSYGDEIITYSGINVYITADEKVYYYHNDPDNGYTLNLGQDPFMQVTKAQREVYINNMLAAIGNIAYNPCDVSIPFGVQYDLGDVLQFPNGQGSATNKFCVMAYEWTYYGGFRIKSIPSLKASKSKTDKNLQGLISTVGRNDFTSYESKNLASIEIGDNEEERLLLARIASNNSTKAQIHVEVNLESVANTPAAEVEDFSDIWSAISDTAVKGIVTYLVNSEEVNFHPTETWIDGKHVLHLMYILPLEANNVTIFEIYLRSVGGTISINQGDVWFYASGAGLVGDGKWDGSFEIQEDVANWNLIDISFASASDNVSAATQTPTSSSASDSVSTWSLVEINFVGASDSVLVETHTDMFRRISENGDVRITESGDVRYTEGD